MVIAMVTMPHRKPVPRNSFLGPILSVNHPPTNVKIKYPIAKDYPIIPKSALVI
jgi:hypothetical protein